MNPPDIPCLVYNYLRECGYLHSAAALSCEAMIKLTDPTLDMVDPGLLRALVGKGLAYAQLESLCLNSNGLISDPDAQQGGHNSSDGNGDNRAVTVSSINTLENKRNGNEYIRLIRYPLSNYKSSAPIGSNHVLRVLRFGPSQEPKLSTRFVVICNQIIYLIDAETKDELASRTLEVTADLAAQAFICPDGLTFALVAKLSTKELSASDEGDSNSSNGSNSTSLYHFVVLNTVSLYILYRYSLPYPTKAISMGNKWITCICDQQNNAIMIPRPLSSRSKSLINLIVHPIPDAVVEHYNSRMYGDMTRPIMSRERGWTTCVFQSAGVCSGLSSYFYILQNEVLALYSPLGILHLYVPFADNEEAGKIVPQYVNLYEFLKLNDPQESLVMYKISFIDSLPYVACLTNNGLAMINYRYLIYGALCTQVERQYSSWAYCKKLDPCTATVETGIWDKHGSIMVCSENRIIILSLETGHPLFTTSLPELQELEDNCTDYSITDFAFVYSNRLVVIVCNSANTMIQCIEIFFNSATNVLEVIQVYKGAGSTAKFIGRDNSNKSKRLYLSMNDCDVIELDFHQSPHRR